jgi:AraC-like DNA-binding protein
MALNIYNLPNDLTPGEVRENKSVIIRRYKALHNTTKNKIILHQNMINLLISGTKTITYLNGTITVHEGEFLILSKGNCLTSEILPKQELFSSILLYFSNDLLADFFIKYNSFLKEEEVTDQKPYLIFKQDPFVLNYINSLNLLLQSGIVLGDEFNLLKLEELLLYLLKLYPAKLRSLLVVAKDNEDMQLRRAVESNIGHSITIEDLAFLCNSSISTFKRRFKNIYATSPQKWFLQRKMQFAADLLKHPDERPGVVYQKIGYENHSSFTQSFKQYYGMTPKKYRDLNVQP